MRNCLRVGTLAVLLATGASLSSPIPAIAYQGQVLETDPGNHRLRMNLMPFAGFWGRGRSLGSALRLAVGLSPNVWINGGAFIPWPLDENEWQEHWNGELGFSFVKNELRGVNESFTLDSSSVRVGDYRITSQSGVQIPTLERHLIGGRVGGRFYRGYADPTPVAGSGSQRLATDRIDLFVGAQFVRAVHTAVYVQGYGVRSRSTWISVGLDLLISPWVDWTVPVEEEGSLLGGRVLGTFGWGGTYSMALSYELGYQPYSAGWYFMGGLGVGIAAGGFK